MASAIGKEIGSSDQGTGYTAPPITLRSELMGVVRGTPMGELLRRYWHPVAMSKAATQTPRKVRLLGENLILFRDGSGQPGLLAENCCHRGASLFYGRVEQDGLRCCYHGWKFSPKGVCLEQPLELDGGTRKHRQPWYPVEERYGLVWAYMGPPQKKPILPRWASLENLKPGEMIEIVLEPGWCDERGIPTHWLHSYENSMDPMHVNWLHEQHSQPQFDYEGREFRKINPTHNILEGVTWSESRWGMKYLSVTPSAYEGMLNEFAVELLIPTAVQVPSFNDLMIHVPIDDNNHSMIQLAKVTQPGTLAKRRINHNGKQWRDCMSEELQRFPGDYEAMKDIPAAAHSGEHLAGSDRGIVMLRRILKREMDKVSRGEDPIGVSFDSTEPAREVASLIRQVRYSSSETRTADQ